MSMLLACCACWRPCACAGWRIPAAFTRLHLELYGKVEEVPQNEKTPFHPYSPYAVAKQYGFWITKEYREAYNMFCCSGILFNHESERRGETFVTRKITLAAARIKPGQAGQALPGQSVQPARLGLCQGLCGVHVADPAERQAGRLCHRHRRAAFRARVLPAGVPHAGIELEFVGEGMDEKGVDKATGKVLIEVSPDFYRPTDVVNLWGDPHQGQARSWAGIPPRPALRNWSSSWWSTTWKKSL
jgi:GDPmannose 4,6-dehydratase